MAKRWTCSRCLIEHKHIEQMPEEDRNVLNRIVQCPDANDELSNEEKQMFIQNVSLKDIISEEPVLGGKWFIQDIVKITDGLYCLGIEDGHIDGMLLIRTSKQKIRKVLEVINYTRGV